MSDNKLLKESTIRRFMKLANVEPLTDKFISEMGMGNTPPAKKGKEQKHKKGHHPAKVYNEEAAEEEVIEEQDEEEPDMEEEPAAEEPDMDMDMDMGDEAEMGAADISLTEEEAQLLIDLGERLKEAMGDAEEMEDEDEPMDDDLAMDEPGDAEAMGDEEMAGDEPAKMYEGVSKEDLVQEILKRVTKRIVSKRVNK